MNKVSLVTVGKKLQDTVYVVSIYDLEPSGLIVSAYDQASSKEYILPVSEHMLSEAEIDRSEAKLNRLIESIELTAQGEEFVLTSTIEQIKSAKQRLLGDALINMVQTPMENSSKSLNDVLVEGLVELCKVKPVGVDAVKWLGEWLIANNPNKPVVSEDAE